MFTIRGYEYTAIKEQRKSHRTHNKYYNSSRISEARDNQNVQLQQLKQVACKHGVMLSKGILKIHQMDNI